MVLHINQKVVLILVPFLAAMVIAMFVVADALFPKIKPVNRSPDDLSIVVNGSKIRYRDTLQTARNLNSKLPTLVLLHGFRGTLDHWQKTVSYLPQYRVVSLDLVGFGGSDRPLISYDLDTQSEYLEDFMQQLGLGKVVLVGISMGASLTAWTAATDPERVAGLIMIAPSGYPGSLQKEWPHDLFYRPGIANRLLCLIVCSDIFAKLYPENLGRQALNVTASYNENFKAALGKIRQPATLVWSPDDDTSQYSYSSRYLKEIRQLKLVTVAKELGHDVIRKNPQGTADIIRAFMQEHGFSGK